MSYEQSKHAILVVGMDTSSETLTETVWKLANEDFL